MKMKCKILICFFIIILIIIGSVVIVQIKNQPKSINDKNKVNINIQQDVSKIECTYNMTNKEEIIYNIVDKERINGFINILKDVKLDVSNENNKLDNSNYLTIITSNINQQMKYIINANYIKYEEKSYKINEKVFNNIIEYLKPAYYLHSSKLNKPSEEECQNMQNKIVKGLNKEEIKKVQELIRNMHMEIESLLASGTKNLKESNSPYWKIYAKGGEMIENTGTGLVFLSEYSFEEVLRSLRKLQEIIKDSTVKLQLKELSTNFQQIIEYKDLGGCFNIHKVIHDYDYWIINYPAYFQQIEPVDWSGIEIYYGTII